MSSTTSGLSSASGEELLQRVTTFLQKVSASRWFIPALNLVALLTLTAGMAHWTWLLWKPPLPQVVPQPAAVAAPMEQFDPQPLLAANVFGQAPPAAGQSLDSIPISSLNLVLTGVAGFGGVSFALIGANGQPQMPFTIGEEVLNGVILRSIYADRVILERGGVSEALMLEGMAQLPPELTVDGLPVVREAAPAPAVPGPDLGIRQSTPNTYTVPRSALDAQLKQPQEFLSQALAVPNPGGGFLMREIQPGSVYEKLGLQAGDVIRSVNGQPVNTIEDAMRLYTQSKGTRNVRLEIVRSGRPEMLQYNVQ